MRFLHVTTFYPPFNFGGDGVYVWRLARLLASDGHEVDVLHNVDAFRVLGDGTLQPGCYEQDDIHRHEIRSRWPAMQVLASHQLGISLQARRRLLALHARNRYDVIHFHNVSLFGPGILKLDDEQAVRLLTTHEHWLVCPLSVLWRMGREICQRPTCVRCSLHARRPPQLWRYSAWRERARRSVDAFLVPTQACRENHVARGFTGPFRLLPPFVEAPAPDVGVPNASGEGHPYFLYVGRLERIKGIYELIEAKRRVPDVVLKVVGSGAEFQRLSSLTRDRDDVELLGPLHPDALADLFRHCLALVVPSLVPETAGLVVLEALVHGAPVIARDIGGQAELVRESGGGMTFDSEDSLVRSMRTLHRSPDIRDQLGAAGQHAVMQRWTGPAHLERYLGLVEEFRRSKQAA